MALRHLRLASTVAGRVPLGVLIRLGEFAGSHAHRVGRAKFEVLVENLSHVRPEASRSELERLARAGFASYGRYWAETLKLPTLSARTIDEGFVVEGYEHLLATREAGYGPIMVLPHLGGWEWAAAWLGRVAEIGVSAVVERLEPEDVFEWFSALRASYGIEVLPLEEGVFSDLVAAVRRRQVVCLLGDRDIAGTGVDVEFFGARVPMPIGPAILSRRTGAPIHPTAVFFDGRKRRCVVGEPIWPEGSGRLRDEAKRTTGKVAEKLEQYISQAPEQWHVLEPVFEASNP